MSLHSVIARFNRRAKKLTRKIRNVPYVVPYFSMNIIGQYDADKFGFKRSVKSVTDGDVQTINADLVLDEKHNNRSIQLEKSIVWIRSDY